MNRRRQITLLLAGVAILTLMVLSAGLSSIELQPARPFSIAGQETNRIRGEVPTLPPELFNTLWQIFALVFMIMLPFAILHFFVSPEGRKRVIRNTLLISVYAIVVLLFIQNLRQRPIDELDSLAGSSAPTEQFTIPDIFLNPPPILIFVIGLLIVIGLAMLAYFFMRRYRTPHETELQVVAREARLALADLQAGADVKDTIMRCYLQMAAALNQSRGVQRKHAMTPREFESYLTRVGFHTDHINRLTRLFEGVRYSSHRPSPRDEREAEDCLRAIVEVYGRAA